jgi:hypothetical protein
MSGMRERLVKVIPRDEDVRIGAASGFLSGAGAGTFILAVKELPATNADTNIEQINNLIEGEQQYPGPTSEKTIHKLQKEIKSFETHRPQHSSAPEIAGLIGGGAVAGTLLAVLVVRGAKAAQARFTSNKTDKGPDGSLSSNSDY